METDDPERNKAIVRRFFDEVWNRGNVALADDLVAETYTSHNKLEIEVLGPIGIKAAVLEQRAAFPDLRTTIEDLVAEGDRVVVRATDRGTFRGPFRGMEPTGNTFTITWIDIFRVEGGQLQEAWLEIDTADFRRQLTGGREHG
jgi:predicted ester cyclase